MLFGSTRGVMRFQGKVFNWNDDKGFGFFEPNGGGERAFVHMNYQDIHDNYWPVVLSVFLLNQLTCW
jgi:hypothetical protein